MKPGKPAKNNRISLNEIRLINREQKKAILKKRAENLAKEFIVEEQEHCIEVVCFRLGNETYGIESDYIRGVHPLKELTFLPGLPPFILGIITLHRRILSVIDLNVLVFLGD